MNWYIYILECSDGTFYTGITNNIEKRLKTHREGKGAKYTRTRLPLTLLCFTTVKTKSEALKYEYKIKQLPKNKKVEFLNNIKGE